MNSTDILFHYLNCLNSDNELLLTNCDQTNLHHSHSSNSSPICNASHNHRNNNNTNNIHSQQYQQGHKSLDSIDNMHIDSQNNNSASNSLVHNGFNKSEVNSIWSMVSFIWNRFNFNAIYFRIRIHESKVQTRLMIILNRSKVIHATTIFILCDRKILMHLKFWKLV